MELVNIASAPKKKTDALSSSAAKTAHVIAVTSGKGGVGKTNISANLGISLAMQGNKVCIFDADIGLANLNVLLGIRPQYTVQHLMDGEKTIEEVMIEGPRGIQIVPAASGLTQYIKEDSESRNRLLKALEWLEKEFDYLLIDTAAGIGENVMSFVGSAESILLIISSEPTSLTDAFALVKVLAKSGNQQPIHVLVNQALSEEHGKQVYRRFHEAVSKYIDRDVSYMGHVLLDELVISSVLLQRPVILQEPDSQASQCFISIAQKIPDLERCPTHELSFSYYWHTLAGLNMEQPEFGSQPELATAPQEKEDEQREEQPKPTIPTIAPPVVAEVDITEEKQVQDQDETTQKEIEVSHSETEEPSKPSPQPVTTEVTSASSLTQLNEADAAVCISESVEEHINRFDSMPFDVKAMLYKSIELSNFSEEAIKNTARTLETLYERRFNQPIKDFEDSLIELFSDANASKERLQSLSKNVEASFQRQFDEPLINVQSRLSDYIETLPEKGHEELAEELDSSFREHFGKDLLGPANEVLEQKDDQIQSLENRVQELEKLQQQNQQDLTEKDSVLLANQSELEAVEHELGLKLKTLNEQASTLTKAQEKTTSMEQQVHSLNAELDEKRACFEQADTENQKAQQQVKEAQQNIESRDKVIQEKEEELFAVIKTNEDSKRAVAAKAEEVATTKQQLEAKTNRVEELDSRNSILETEVVTLENSLTDSEQQLATFQEKQNAIMSIIQSNLANMNQPAPDSK